MIVQIIVTMQAEDADRAGGQAGAEQVAAQVLDAEHEQPRTGEDIDDADRDDDQADDRQP